MREHLKWKFLFDNVWKLRNILKYIRINHIILNTYYNDNDNTIFICNICYIVKENDEK